MSPAVTRQDYVSSKRHYCDMSAKRGAHSWASRQAVRIPTQISTQAAIFRPKLRLKNGQTPVSARGLGHRCILADCITLQRICRVRKKQSQAREPAIGRVHPSIGRPPRMPSDLDPEPGGSRRPHSGHIRYVRRGTRATVTHWIATMTQAVGSRISGPWRTLQGTSLGATRPAFNEAFATEPELPWPLLLDERFIERRLHRVHSTL